MISLSELNKKIYKPWETGAFLSSWLLGENFFPLEIPLKLARGRTLSNEFIKVREWIFTLEQNSKTIKNSGYHLKYCIIKHQQLGQQRIPSGVLFANQQDWLYYIKKQNLFLKFQHLSEITQQKLPQAMQLIQSKPLKLLKYANVWEQLLKVCYYFLLNPLPQKYIRQLDIQGVDSKFIEQHKSILSELLCLVLDSKYFDVRINGIVDNNFERRFGLLYDEPLIRFRLLDNSAIIKDISVPISQFVDQGVNTVYITENKINGLAFPIKKNTMVIFGLGYGIRSLFAVDWLKKKQIIYWGDIDTHGFSILSQLRSCFSQTKSLLMDEKTLKQHQTLCGEEPATKRYLAELTNLTKDETNLYNKLRFNTIGNNIRLEQERISYFWLQQYLTFAQ